MARDERLDALHDELETDAEAYFSAGRWTNFLDLSLTTLTVIASLVATVLATTDAKSIARWIVAAVAAVPAAATALQRIIGIRDRCNWYFLYAAQVRALATRLKYASSANLAEFAARRAELEVEMEKDWLRIGHSGTVPMARARSRKGGG